MTRTLIVVACLLASSCTSTPMRFRSNTTIDSKRYSVACEGAYDVEPRLMNGKVPVYPVTMLNPTLIEDRKVRHLPMRWPVVATFNVTSEGATEDVVSTATTPASFGQHMTIAVRSWRFQPATASGIAVSARCSAGFTFLLAEQTPRAAPS